MFIPLKFLNSSCNYEILKYTNCLNINKILEAAQSNTPVSFYKKELKYIIKRTVENSVPFLIIPIKTRISLLLFFIKYLKDKPKISAWNSLYIFAQCHIQRCLRTVLKIVTPVINLNKLSLIAALNLNFYLIGLLK